MKRVEDNDLENYASKSKENASKRAWQYSIVFASKLG
jgi:hypothetical protein